MSARSRYAVVAEGLQATIEFRNRTMQRQRHQAVVLTRGAAPASRPASGAPDTHG